MPKTIGVGTVTLTDLTDAIVANTEPDIKEVGTLWIDSTGGNNILKEWNGSRWVTVTLDVSSLDPDLAEKVTNMERKLGNIGTDGELDYEDRVLLTEFLSQIVGETLSTSNTIKYGNSLPDYTVLDSQGRGSFAAYRSNALAAGVGEDSTEYLALQQAYTDMNNYLSRYTPKPWDIRTSQKSKIINIGTGDVFRQKLLDYYLAELALVTTTTEVANEKLADVSLKDKDRVSGKELYTDKADDSVVHVEVDGKSYQHAKDDSKNLAPHLEHWEFLNGATYNRRNDTATIPVGGRIGVWVPWDGTKTQVKGGFDVISGGNQYINFGYYDSDKSTPVMDVNNLGTINGYTGSIKAGERATSIGWYAIDDKVKYIRVQISGSSAYVSEPYTIKNISIRSDNYEYEPPAPTPDYPVEIHSLNDFDVVSSVGRENLIKNVNGRPSSMSGGGSTPPTVELVNMETPFGSEAYKITFPANNNTGYWGSRAVTNRLTMYGGKIYSYHTYVYYPDGKASGVAMYPAGSAGMKGLSADTSKDIGGWKYYSTENILLPSIYKTANNYMTYYANSVFSSPKTIYVSVVKFEEGAEATPYSPRLEDITEDDNHPLIDKINLLLSEPLRSVGDVKDKLFRDNDGLWKVERNVAELAINNSSGWGYHNLSNTEKDNYERRIVTTTIGHPRQIVSDRFTGTLNQNPPINNIRMSQIGYLNFAVEKGTISNLSEWFSQNPFTILYEEVPTIETLDQDLQDKLNNLRSFQDSNYVYTIINDKTDIIAEQLKPRISATFKSRGWYKQFTTDKDIMDSDASGGSALHSTRLPQPVQIPELSNNSRNAFTLEVLVYALADGPYTILQRENGNPVLSLTETSDGLGVTWDTTTFSNPDAISPGAWTRISLTTNDVGEGNFSLYVDGNFISGLTISLPTNLNNLYISPNFDGYISDLRLWNVGMSDTEIHEIANHSLEGNEDHLVYNYKLNGGTRLYDTGPYANHIEIRNGEIPWVHESIALKDVQDSEQKKRGEALGDMQDSLITTFESGQVNTSDSLTQYINQIKTDLDGKIQETQTTFNTLNSDGLSVGLGDVRALSEANQDSIDKLEAVFNMNPSTQVLTIGAPSSQYRLELSPQKMVFKDGTADVAEISNQQLKINKGIFVQSLQVGEHAFTQYADGMTTIAWTGK